MVTKRISTKKKLTHRERGYVTRQQAALMLRRIAATVEEPTDGCLVKISMQMWLASEDEPQRRAN